MWPIEKEFLFCGNAVFMLSLMLYPSLWLLLQGMCTNLACECYYYTRFQRDVTCLPNSSSCWCQLNHSEQEWLQTHP